MNTQNVSRDDWILGGVALLLVIDLLFLPWFDVSLGPISFTWSATSYPDGGWGVLAVLFALALIADLAIDRLMPQAQLPALAGGRAQTRFVLAVLTALFVALKFVFNIHFGDFGFGFWLGVILTVALVYLAVQARNAGVGVVGGV